MAGIGRDRRARLLTPRAGHGDAAGNWGAKTNSLLSRPK